MNIGRPQAQEFVGLYTDHWLAKGDENDTIRKKLDWNKLYIFAHGGHIKAKLNDVELFDYTDPSPAPRLVQSGVLGLQTYGAERVRGLGEIPEHSHPGPSDGVLPDGHKPAATPSASGRS